MRLRHLVFPLFAAVACADPPRAAVNAGPPADLVVSVGHAGAPQVAAFVADLLVTGSWSNIALIDLSTGLTIAHLPQESLVTTIEASPTDDVIAVGTCGHAVQLWNVKTRSLVRRIALSQECPESVAFSPDGSLLAVAAYGCCRDRGLQVWDLQSGALKQDLPTSSGIRSVAFSRDGGSLVGVDDDGKATVFEWPSGRHLQSFDGLEGSGFSETAALLSPDGRYFVWQGMRDLKIWDVATGFPLTVQTARTEQPVPASAAEFLDDGRLAYAADERLIILTLPNGPMEETRLEQPVTEWSGDVGITTSPSWMTIRRDGRLVAGTNWPRTVLWDVVASKPRDLTAPALTDARSLEWSRSGLVAWADFQSGIRAWSDWSGEPVTVGTDVGSATAIAFRPDGQRLAAADSTEVHMLGLRHRRSVTSLQIPAATRTGIAFSPDGSRLAFASSEGFALFDGRLRRRTTLAPREPYTSAEYVAFSPDGRWIAAGLSGPQPSVRVWPDRVLGR